MVLGQMRAIIKEESAVPHMRWLKEYPDTPFIRYTGLWGAERVMVSSSKAFQHILQNAYNYPKPPDFSESLRRILGAKGILFAEGNIFDRMWSPDPSRRCPSSTEEADESCHFLFQYKKHCSDLLGEGPKLDRSVVRRV